MPKDVQEAVFTPDFDMEMDLPGYNPVLPFPRKSWKPSSPSLKTPAVLSSMPAAASSPRKPPRTCWEFAERTQIPVATT